VHVDLDIGHGITLGGEISRVDIEAARGEYRAILLDAPASDWTRELRMPLIQIAMAQKFERDPSDVTVGFQPIGGSRLSSHRFGSRALTAAMAEVTRITTVLRRELR